MKMITKQLKGTIDVEQVLNNLLDQEVNMAEIEATAARFNTDFLVLDELEESVIITV